VGLLSRVKARKKTPWYFKIENQFISVIVFIGLMSSVEGQRLVGQVFLLALAALLAYGFYRIFLKKGKLPQVKELYEVDEMNGFEFENYLAPIFEKYGYRAEVTKGSGDFGADLILRKGRKKYVVQAKRYNNTIGVSAVQQIVAAVGYYKADGAMVVTNNYFTPAAADLAKHNGVQLIDRDELSYMIKKQRSRFWQR
jgi:restriction system protein